ncbi:hypothetical protein C923_04422 [Plasmodium falciparum UGT5.1]|uniref:Uncharacterized protein n=6 Tax=Plasmodium falciparum TaxID=5833 RepID=W7JQJ3_PLAFO|nr:hypothetical protein PFTANZ_04314 [Plasmodium falciparum Tanzania (2000708)]ETW47791.1 hypothetical protein PFMALIP_04190 [Plasmodium falciparum MaliPS096_E11]ETW54791.1 hypothetical protein PFUGPA_03393 [Plasmodium falciparum Palo Alto/Uganda]ETW59842.1 hypothetical protein PFMC_04304 [Plasmodium falciparum CAMP/Malaysia]EWC74900.1 hypothetical protein C923_04422 [Plasmodium falciparum UGT5.1]EWC86991.1 hypothetical protein PFNF54_04171 [Plasmodium falciparum NF54]
MSFFVFLKAHNHHENIQGNTLSNFEIMKEKNNVSNIQLNSSKFFDILASTSLMRNSGGAMSQGPVYRVVQNIHDNNENIGASLVFVIFLLLVVFILFFIFYFIFKNHVKHVKFMNS